MSEDELREARREARVEATLFVLLALTLLVALAVASLAAGWELLGLEGWLWLVLCVPELLLIGAFVLSSDTTTNDAARRRRLLILLAVMGVGNAAGLLVLVGALLTEESHDLSGGQLLTSGVVVWLTNVIVFGLWYWTLDSGGPMHRALQGRPVPDFLFPQDDPDTPGREGWYPRLEDYVYVALTNGIAFSPTDAMPLSRWAKASMAAESMISVAAILLVAARAVNVLG
jgi:hypothetical protein